jgi:hypothetical protein
LNRIGEYNGKEIEGRIQNEIRADERDGLTFARLGQMNQAATVKRIQELFTDSEMTLRRKAYEERRKAFEKRRRQERINDFLQPKTNKFSTKLKNTNGGKNILVLLAKVVEEFSTLLPLLLQKMGEEDLKPIGKPSKDDVSSLSFPHMMCANVRKQSLRSDSACYNTCLSQLL